MLRPLKIPESFNYIGVFLTLRCNFGCNYCINKQGDFKHTDELSVKGWIEGLGRIQTRDDLPITFQGGEPTLYPGWMEVANALWREDKPLDLLTNGSFNVPLFMDKVEPSVFKRDAKYASIRVSFHPTQHDAHALATKVFILQNRGYSIGIWGLGHPAFKNQNRLMKRICQSYGIDFRIKDYLGQFKGNWYGEMKYKGACREDMEDKEYEGGVECRTTELLINPSGHIFRCHSDLYANRNPIAHILDAELDGKIGRWEGCGNFGMCNPCDIKIKNNRMQEFGHTSVEIREIKRG
jgi:pyruvate-formate lyase-activating enzyme